MSFPRYPAYKDSGVEWLGEVPEHWNRTSLKFLADYQNGYPFKPDDRGEDGLPIIRISQLTGDDEPAYYCGQLDERTKVRCGDLLFSWSATIDSYIWNKGDAWLNQHIFRVSPSAEANKKYLYYVIKHVAPKLADFDAHGSTMRHIKKESLGEKVYAPSVFEQGLIATFLDHETAKIDALIAEQQRLIELLQEKRQAVISHAVTKGLNPDAPMKDSGVEWLGEVPEHWALHKLKHVASFSGGGTPSRENLAFWNGDIPWVSPKDMKVERIVDSEETITEIGLQNSSSKLQAAFQVLMVVRSGILLHTIPVAINEVSVALNQDMKAIDFGHHRVISEFFLRWVQGLNNLLLLAWAKQGATVESIEQTYLAETIIAMPDLFESAGIIKYLEVELVKFDSLASNAHRAINLLQERRSALISAAVTGQIDLRGLVPEEAAA